MKSKVLHQAPPLGFNSKGSVVIAYIEWNGKLLFLLTHPNKAQGLTWSVPGGKIDSGETPIQAIVREVKEETGIQMSQESFFDCGKLYARTSRDDFNLQIFKAKVDMLPSVTINQREHTEFRWLEPREIVRLPLMEGADECLEWVYGAIK